MSLEYRIVRRMLFSRDDEKDGGHDTGQCELLGSFALLVQAALGALALLSLVYKRWRERPQRPVKIWFFDASKQVVGSVLVHIANLLLSMLSSGRFNTSPHSSSVSMFRRHEDDGDEEHYHPNPCSFYLLNLAIDTTIGIAILIYALRLITLLCERLPPNWAFSYGITSGDYGDPPKATSWIKQSVIYFAGLMVMKFVVGIMFAIFPITLGKFGDFLLQWTEGNRKVQIAFVMFIFPLIMNAMQYYIVDIFIKKQEKASPHLPDDEERVPIARAEDDSDDDVDLPHDSNIPQLQPSSAAAAGATGGPRRKASTRTRSFEDSANVYSTDEDDEHAIATEEGKAFLKAQKQSSGKKGASSTKIEEYNPETDGDIGVTGGSSKPDGRR